MVKKKKIIIITAASRGMGRACAQALADEDHKLVLMSRSNDLFPLADQLDARPIKGSVDSPQDIERIVGFTYEKYGRVDMVVNNTGHAAKGALSKLSDEDWKEGMNLLLLNVIRMSRMVAPIMQKQGKGSIVNISTFAAKEPNLSFPVSSVMRSALSSYTKLFAKEYGADGIRMNNVLPGYIDSYPADHQTIQNIPLLRQGKPEEVAELVRFLSMDISSYITGQDFTIDGGLTNSI
jgi:NAD(P)-dependent dehydrogenase (short-subunit alcohol dehydrogenase family)